MVTSIPTVVAAAQETVRVLVRPLACFKAAVRPVNQPSQTSAPRLTPGRKVNAFKSCRFNNVDARDGVRLGQVEGCELCDIQPRAVGTMCISCDRLVRIEPRLREVKADGPVFKNCEPSCFQSHCVLRVWSVRAQFLSEWESADVSPALEKIYEVILPRDQRVRHEHYK